MTHWGIYLEVEPRAAARPRTRVIVPRSSGKPFAQIYEHTKDQKWKEAVREIVQPTKPTMWSTEALSVTLLTQFEVAKSNHRKTHPVPAKVHRKKPDVDNLAKLILDALSGIVWRDDCQIAELTVRKAWGYQEERACVGILVRPIETGWLDEFRRQVQWLKSRYPAPQNAASAPISQSTGEHDAEPW